MSWCVIQRPGMKVWLYWEDAVLSFRDTIQGQIYVVANVSANG